MEKRIKHDLKISGSAIASGGSYNNVVISGQGDINGDFDCVELKVSGASKLNGNVQAGSGKVMGTATITGDLKADDFKVGGFMQVRGNVEVKVFRVEGGLVVGNNFSAESLEIKGGLKVKNDCNAETFVSKGAFTVGGLLSGDSVNIVLYGPCRAKEIGGENIEVHRASTFHIAQIVKSILSSLDLENGLVVDLIEGDDIYLEETKAKVVRGNNITIGDGCEIGLVEYKGKYEQTGNAKVKENKKVR
jgi:cytoskeletal protein CcmA (bactofilin family)